MMTYKDDNKRKYAVDGTEEEAEEASPKKQKTICGKDNSDNHGDDDNCNDSSTFSSIDDDYSSELEEEVCLEVKMNIPTSSEEELLIRRGCSEDGDTSNN
jgi:hypothetical protein